MSLQQALAVPREELEQGMHLLALLLFRNEVKLDTAQAIADLKQGQVLLPFWTPLPTFVMPSVVYVVVLSCSFVMY